jgi:LacI family transcriptional regulator
MVNKKHVTLKDIAKDTCFSITTISHVINKTRHVDNATRQAVLESIKRLGYQTSKKKSQKIDSKKVKNIGMVIADIREDFFADLIKHTESIFRHYGYNIIFCDSEQTPEIEANCIASLLKNNIEGLILTPTNTSQEYPILREQNIPTVLIDRNVDSADFDFVGIDNFRSTLEATQKLIKLNLKNIAFMGYTDTNYTIKERKAGYKTAMLEAGLLKKENILQVSYHNKSSKSKSIYHFIKDNPELEGIICASTVICYEAIGCITEIYSGNYSKIKLITYDDNKWYNYLTQKVSAIKTPTVDAAAVAVELLLNKIKDPFTKTVPKKILLNYEYVNRF